MTDNWAGPFPGAYWVQPGKLLAGPYPGSGGGIDRLARLRAAGVTCFVDLTEAGERRGYRVDLPPGVEYWRCPIRDFGTPSRDALRDTLDTIDAALLRGKVVYVHCQAGIGRTGTVIGCYWVRHGLTGEQALAALAQRAGEDSPETPEQRALVRSWREGSG